METGNQCRAEATHAVEQRRVHTPAQVCCLHFEMHAERELGYARRAVDLRIMAGIRAAVRGPAKHPREPRGHRPSPVTKKD